MLSEDMYNDLSPELVEARARAGRLADAYDRSLGQRVTVREAHLRRHFRMVGSRSFFKPTFRSSSGSIYVWARASTPILIASSSIGLR